MDFEAKDGGATGLRGHLVSPGNCETYYVPDFPGGTVISTYGRYNTSNNEFHITNLLYPTHMSVGLKFLCGGTTANAGSGAYCNIVT
ncbi:hypothetical protein ACH4KU_06530 [Streptomyces althioticus]